MELALPMNYAELEQEEMMYLDGGTYYSKAQCRNALVTIGISPQVAIAASVTATLISKVVKWGKAIGGAVSWVISTAVRLMAIAVGKILYGLGMGASIKNGVNISGSLAPWEAFVNVTL